MTWPTEAAREAVTDARPLTARERTKLAALRRRRDYLTGLIESGESTLSWDLQERGALSWAIDQITAARPERADREAGR